MPIQLILLFLLILIFFIGTKFEVNIGIVAIVFAYIEGTFVLDMKTSEIIAGFPSDLFIMLFGLLLLMTIASLNGTVNYLVGKMVQLSQGNIMLLPWVIFFSGVIISSFGPPAAPILFIIGLGFASKYNVNPLLMGAMALHGTQAGMYSPIAPYGVYVGSLVRQTGFTIDPWLFYAWIVLLAFLLAVVLFFVFGGKKLIGRKLDKEVIQTTVEQGGQLDFTRILTLLGFIFLLIGSFFRPRDLGLIAIVVSAVLLLFTKKEIKEQIFQRMGWRVLLIVVGVLVYVNVLQTVGTFIWLAEQGNSLGAPKLVALIMSYVAAAVTAVSSTFGTYGFLIPMTGPFMETATFDSTLFLVALAFSTSVTDISPFSPFGAILLGFAGEDIDKDKLMKDMFKYTFALILIMPLVTWLILVLPSW